MLDSIYRFALRLHPTIPTHPSTDNDPHVRCTPHPAGGQQLLPRNAIPPLCRRHVSYTWVY
ncbi:hypothetical protein E2C01_040299 [Portunus trituberculatus]|uniref:Uncharacterized protein n=1 Tax=Portunus trituberculatus TaxID=210409 RepID=A0A5B7FNU3_PORTR|nr:hypothetical protein [Portunus trituberculatus]